MRDIIFSIIISCLLGLSITHLRMYNTYLDSSPKSTGENYQRNESSFKIFKNEKKQKELKP